MSDLNTIDSVPLNYLINNHNESHNDKDNDHDNNNMDDNDHDDENGTSVPEKRSLLIDTVDTNNEGQFKKKRLRAAKACTVCHNRKVKCDVSSKSEGESCSNCKDFNCECIIYIRKKRSANRKKSEILFDKFTKENGKQAKNEDHYSIVNSNPNISVYNGSNMTDIINNNINTGISNNSVKNDKINNFPEKISKDNTTKSSSKKKYSQPSVSPIPPTRSIGNSSILTSTLNELSTCSDDSSTDNTSNVPRPPSIFRKFLKQNAQVSYPQLSEIRLDSKIVFKEDMGKLILFEFMTNENNNTSTLKDIFDKSVCSITENGNTRSYQLDQMDYKVLDMFGCYNLPKEEICWTYIDNYFKYMNVQFPIINKVNFYETYKDLKNPPSLLLLNSILYIGAWQTNVTNLTTEDQNQNDQIAEIFFRRAKLIYDYSLEVDPIAIVQSLLCFSFHYDNMSTLSKNDYYWSRVAITIALQYGFNRESVAERLTDYEKKMRKQLWWLLVLKDRMTGLGFSKPFIINLEDSEVSMLTDIDLQNSGMTKLERAYLINFIKFGKLIGRIIGEQNKINKMCSSGRSILPLLKKCDLMMIHWLQGLPKELKFKLNDESTQSFLSGLLMSQYYALLVAVHKSNILRDTAQCYPSWAISFQATQMLKLLCDCFASKNLIQHVALISHSTLSSPGIIMMYHLINKDERISKIANDFFLRILGIWKRSCHKWPGVYPLLSVFSQIYNSQETKRLLVSSIAPKNDSEMKPISLGHSDLSLLFDPNFKIGKLNDDLDSYCLDSRAKLKKLEGLDIDFDKLFTESVFTKTDTLIPKLDLGFIDINSVKNQKTKNNSREKKIYTENSEYNESDANCESDQIKTNSTVKITGEKDNNEGNEEGDDGHNEDMQANEEKVTEEKQHISYDVHNLINSNQLPLLSSISNTSNDNAGGIQISNGENLNAAGNDMYDHKSLTQELNSVNLANASDISSLPLHSFDQMSSNVNENGNEEFSNSLISSDVPISLWLMKKNWKPQFDLDETQNHNNAYDISHDTNVKTEPNEHFMGMPDSIHENGSHYGNLHPAQSLNPEHMNNKNFSIPLNVQSRASIIQPEVHSSYQQIHSDIVGVLPNQMSIVPEYRPANMATIASLNNPTQPILSQQPMQWSSNDNIMKQHLPPPQFASIYPITVNNNNDNASDGDNNISNTNANNERDNTNKNNNNSNLITDSGHLSHETLMNERNHTMKSNHFDKKNYDNNSYNANYNQQNSSSQAGGQSYTNSNPHQLSHIHPNGYYDHSPHPNSIGNTNMHHGSIIGGNAIMNGNGTNNMLPVVDVMFDGSTNTDSSGGNPFKYFRQF